MGLIVAALAVSCLGAAGCASANSSSNPPSGSPTSASPSQPVRSSSPTASSSPTVVRTAAPRTYTYHGLVIQLEAGWKPGRIVHANDGSTSYRGVLTGGSCNSSSFGMDCPGFILLQPSAYQTGQPFQYGSGQDGCPQDRNLMQNWPSNSQPITADVTVGGRKAYLTQSTVQCISNAPNGGATKSYIQYVWWVPSANILVVEDGWLTPGLGSVLTRATWATSDAPTMADFVGTWHRHTDEFVIKANGSGTETDGDGICPNNPSWMCGFAAVLSFTMTTSGLKATYTSVTPTVNGSPSSEYTLDPSEPQVHDSFVLVLDEGDRLVITSLSRPTSFNGPGRTLLCGPKTPAQFEDCGA